MQNLSSFLRTLPFPDDQTILLVDIGARWGANTPWDQLDKKYVTYIGFEPDEEEPVASALEPGLPGFFDVIDQLVLDRDLHVASNYIQPWPTYGFQMCDEGKAEAWYDDRASAWRADFTPFG